MAGYIVTSPNGIDVPDPDDDTVVHYASGAVVPLSKFLPSSYKWLVKNGLISETESGFSGGGGGSSTWGGITGTLSDQTDLQTVLNAKAPAAGPTFTGTVVLPSTTSIGTVTNVEIGYLSGVTSSIQTQLGGKAASSHTHAQSDITNLVTDLSAKAPLASPSLTGTPLSTTAAVDTNTTQIATTAYVVGQGYLKSATASSTYAPIASPTFTGTVTLPSGTSIGTVSNTEIGYLDGVSSSIQTQISDRLPLGGGTLTGNLTLNKTTPSLSLTGSGVGSLRITSSDNNALLYLGAPAGLGYSGIQLLSGSNARWYLRKNFATESGSNAGSNLEFAAIADDGSTTISTPFSITRSTGLTTLSSLTVSGVSSFTGASSFTGQMSLVNGVPATVKFAKASQWGYSSGYRAIVLGDTAGSPNNVTVSIGYDPVGNANGSFTGDGREVLFRNAVEFTTPNAANNAWLKPLKFDSTGNSTMVGLTLTGTLTAVTANFTGDLTISKASPILRLNASAATHTNLYLDSPAGYASDITFRSGTAARWAISKMNSAESGSDVGSDFQIFRYKDDGSYSVPFKITRSTGATTLTGDLTISKTDPVINMSGAGTAIAKFSSTTGTSEIRLNSATANGAYLNYMTADSKRWAIWKTNDTESGSNAGSNLEFHRYSDAGASIGAALTITRSTGAVTLTGNLSAAYNSSSYQAVQLGGTVIKRNQTGNYSGLEIVDGSDNINAEIMVNGFATFKGDITINKGSSPALILGSSGPKVVSGSGTPEAVVTAPIGSIFLRSNGSAATTLYIKESGAGDTGWVAANPAVPEPVIALAVGDSVPGGTPSGTIIVRYTP